MRLIKSILFLTFFIFVPNLFSQSADTSQAYIAPGEIVEAGEALIKIEVEKPQVQMFSQRIKPEFDEVNLEKSFLKEILDEGQIVEIETSESSKYIDIDKLITRNR